MNQEEEVEFIKGFAEMLTEKWKQKGTVTNEENKKYNIAERWFGFCVHIGSGALY